MNKSLRHYFKTRKNYNKKLNKQAYFTEDGRLMFKPIKPDEYKQIKGRQGRSHETRLRRRREKYHQNKQAIKDEVLDFCTHCWSDQVFLDDKSSSMVCLTCGYVDEILNTRAMVFNDTSKSKPYERVVHYQQRISSVKGMDPEVENECVRRIEDFLCKNPEICGNSLYYAGWQAIKSAIKHLGIKPVYASRWIQIRSRFNIKGVDKEVAAIPGDLENVLKLRYILVSRAFDQTILKDMSLLVERKNMLNMNYVIPMLIRMESEQIFRETAKFFPQNRSDYQPALNNERMKIIVDYCKEHFTKVYSYKGETINLIWEFTPLTAEDIFNYFIYFR